MKKTQNESKNLKQQGDKSKLSLTISGIGGVGKGTTAKLLGEKLKCKVISGGDFFRKKAEELGKNLYEFEKFVQENPKYDRELDLMQKKFGEENKNFILESRLGWFFIPDSIKIKLICEENERLKRVGDREEIDFEEIKKKENERLKSIEKRYKELYGIENFQDDKNFDLIIDTTKKNPEKVVKIIMVYLKGML